MIEIDQNPLRVALLYGNASTLSKGATTDSSSPLMFEI